MAISSVSGGAHPWTEPCTGCEDQEMPPNKRMQLAALQF